METEVIRSWRVAGEPPIDKAGYWLARTYARAIDQDEELLSDLGPKLEKTLTAIGLTAAGRGVVKGKAEGVTNDVASNSPEDQLAEARKRRGPGARRNQASTLDTTAG
ncbi:terminase small subunit [Micromonospora arida]